MARKRIFFVFNLFFFVMIGVIFYQTFETYLIKKEVNREIKNTEKEVQEYAEKKKKLESNIKNFSEEEKIERVARDRLNLKKEGEITYKIIE
ncbi:septation ring formation regulator EzrA [Leptotrichia sp. OH3620_COT-345]|uniref:septum formation initiator family protein n=1 Tax=Leptotrichia sp. OH3620_COT-345 TaxID=2491048 RepID=UPI000F6472E8|nr:septum formation initiator family protein [Leptotrichia sp. OH3620_COT-345]RRD38944.1 septation ring formation regulator EzrA [Leptotrichia sp. OH3620_COT-345]